MPVWTYQDARRRNDEAAAAAAWQWARDAVARTGPSSWVPTQMIAAAVESDDLDRAIDLLLEWYPRIDTSTVGTDSGRRAEARSFVSLCISVLEREASIGHPQEAALDAAMREMHDRHEDIPMPHHRAGFARVGELRARRRIQAAIAEARQSPQYDPLPPLSTARRRPDRPPHPAEDDPRGINGRLGPNPWLAMTLADAATDAAWTHGDTGPLDRLIGQLEQTDGYPILTGLVRARRRLVDRDLAGAIGELERASAAGRDLLRRWLSPHLYATLCLLRARQNPAALDQAIELCQCGRRAGRGRVTAADTALATLLLRRAARPGTPAAQREADIREADRLTRRRASWWNLRNADDLLARHDAIAAKDALTGRPNLGQRQRAWRESLREHWRWSLAEQARLAQAWAQWAASTEVAEFAAEAYYYLVELAAKDAVSRYRDSARQHALAGAQEYAEEAGYWLARTGNYREAVVALELGRAVGLTQVLGRQSGPVTERLRAAGRADLAHEYGRAMATYATLERTASPQLRRAWVRLHDVAARVKAVIGVDPLIPEVDYDDIIRQTGDGALLYLAAATAGGYALVVSAHHDPQFVDLPKLDRASIRAIADTMLPGARTLPGARNHAARDLAVAGRPSDEPTTEGLRRLWWDGLVNLLLFSARGRVVSFVPVGLLSLLPLHAAGDPGPPDDEYRASRHAGAFATVRYAPNARALDACRRTAHTVHAMGPRGQTLLAVAAPLGPGGAAAQRLRYVGREVDEVARRWGPTATPVHECTWAQFRAMADRYTVWHLACHAAADPNSIMDSRLIFTDKEVTLEELRRTLPPGRRRLAVLSACQTNVTGVAMPNEMVGLPSALIELGFAGVIASAWRVDDLATAYLMTAFYQYWRQEGDEPAVALNRAQHWLRTATRADLAAMLPGVEPGPGHDDKYPYAAARYWAPFAYTGV